jgi:hypothetical protein
MQKDKSIFDAKALPRLDEIKIHYHFSETANPIAGFWIDAIERIYVTHEKEFVPINFKGRIHPDKPQVFKLTLGEHDLIYHMDVYSPNNNYYEVIKGIKIWTSKGEFEIGEVNKDCVVP